MSKQIIVKDDLMVRLVSAAKNGDRIATFIVNELKSKKDRSEILTGKANYFSCDVSQSNNLTNTKISVGYSSLDNKSSYGKQLLRLDKDAIYTKKQRNSCNLAAFGKMFKNLPDELNRDKIWEEFNEAMKVGSPLKAVISDNIYDFKYAYNGGNYQPYRGDGDSNDTLNHSCMRHDNMTETVASFYCNVGKCKIMLIKNCLEQVVGRAIIWPDVTLGRLSNRHKIEHVSFCSRMYYTCVGVKDFMIREAKKAGIQMRLAVQSLDCRSNFILLNDIPGLNTLTSVNGSGRFDVDAVYSQLHPTFKHKIGGIPYVDVYGSIVKNGEDLYLATSIGREDKELACVHTTGGSVSSNSMICPVCGESMTRVTKGLRICPACIKKHETQTVFGCKMNLKVVDVPGYGLTPAICTKHGKLTKLAAYSNMMRQLSNRERQ